MVTMPSPSRRISTGRDRPATSRVPLTCGSDWRSQTKSPRQKRHTRSAREPSAMPVRRRWLRRTGIALGSLALLVCLFCLGLFVWLRQSLPQVSGTLEVAGLSRPVEIRRDGDGIVTIRAAAENDAYFALGFVH